MSRSTSPAIPNEGDAGEPLSGEPAAWPDNPLVGSPPDPIAVRLIDLLIRFIFSLLLVFLPAAYGAVHAWSEHVAVVGMSAIALLLAIRILFDRPRWHPTLWTAAIVAFLIITSAQLVPLPRSVIEGVSPATAQTKIDLLADLPDARESLARITPSFYPHATRHDLRTVLMAVVALATLVIVYRDPVRLRRLLTVIALIGGATGALALAQGLSGTHKIYWTIDIETLANSGPFINHSHFGQFMNLSIGCALALLLMQAARGKWIQSMFAGGIIVLGLVTISLSLTRGGTIAMFVAGALTLIVLLSQKSMRWSIGVISALSLCAIFSITYIGFDKVYDRMTDPRGAGVRVQIISDSMAIVHRFPVTGIGLGSFEWVYPAYNHTNSASITTHPENEYVQVAVETGLIGLAVVLTFAGAIWWRYAQTVRSGGANALAAIGLGYGLIAVMLQSLSDFGQHLPAIACLSAISCGAIINLSTRRDGSDDAFQGFPPGARKLPLLAAIAAAIIVTLISIWACIDAARVHAGDIAWRQSDTLDYNVNQIDRDLVPADFADLLAMIDRAVAADPDDAHLRYWSAVYHRRALGRQIDPDSGRLVISSAAIIDALNIVDQLNSARRCCPTYGAVYTQLGQVEDRFLNRATALEHIQTGARLDPSDPTANFVAGRAVARSGVIDRAIEYFQTAVLLDSDMMDDVMDFAIDGLDQPSVAIAVGEGDFHRLMQVAGALEKRERYHDLSHQIVVQAVDALEAKVLADGDNARDWDLATLASYLASLGQNQKAVAYYDRAMQKDATNLSWRLQQIDALAAIGRFDQALEAARSAQRLFPTSPQAKNKVDQLLAPKSLNR